MKILTGSRGDEVHEHLYKNGQRRVGHRILKKNTVTKRGEKEEKDQLVVWSFFSF